MMANITCNLVDLGLKGGAMPMAFLWEISRWGHLLIKSTIHFLTNREALSKVRGMALCGLINLVITGTSRPWWSTSKIILNDVSVFGQPVLIMTACSIAILPMVIIHNTYRPERKII